MFMYCNKEVISLSEALPKSLKCHWVVLPPSYLLLNLGQQTMLTEIKCIGSLFFSWQPLSHEDETRTTISLYTCDACYGLTLHSNISFHHLVFSLSIACCTHIYSRVTSLTSLNDQFLRLRHNFSIFCPCERRFWKT